jgi:hypothetical protein
MVTYLEIKLLMLVSYREGDGRNGEIQKTLTEHLLGRPSYLQVPGGNI